MNHEEMLQLMAEAERRGDMDTAKLILSKIEERSVLDTGSDNIGGISMAENPTGEVVARNPSPYTVLDKPETIMQKIKRMTASVVEPAATFISGSVAEPVAGLASIAGAQFVDPGLIESVITNPVRDALTYEPRTKEGMASTQAIAGALSPVTENFSQAESYLGDKAYDITGNPVAGAVGASIPTAAAELAAVGLAKGGIGAIRRYSKKGVNKKIDASIKESTPDAATLKSESSSVYKEIDDMGVSLKPEAYEKLVTKLRSTVERMGLDPDNSPKAYKALKRFEELLDESPTLTEIDIRRKIAQSAAGTIDGADKAMGSAMLEIVDDFLDNVKPDSLNAPSNVHKGLIGEKYKVARDLWGRSKRSDMLTEAIEKARLQDSGFENGIRVQFRQIINNKKKSKYFKTEELVAMKDVVEGRYFSKGGANLYRLLGKFGIGEGRATQIIGSAMGATGGALVAGTPGAIFVPLIGQLSKTLAQRVTKANAAFADQIIRAGSDAKKITAAYMQNTPKAKRTAAELSELLMRPDIKLSAISKSPTIENVAAKLARARRTELAALSASGNEQPHLKVVGEN